MKTADASEVFLACEECVNRYVSSCRDRVDGFVARNFSARELMQFHRRWLLRDFLCYPINVLWALPYLFLRKIVETLDKLGFSGLQQFFARVPSGMKTRYEREVESRIESELLEWPRALFDQLRSDTRLVSLMKAGALSASDVFPAASVKALLKEHSAGRAAVSNLSGTAGTMLVGWLIFHDQNMSVAEVGSRLAHEHAQDRSASHFFLGKGLGRVWYAVVPPDPTRMDMAIGIGAATLLVVCIYLAVSLSMDPLRKALGLQQKALRAFIDRIEEHLHLQAAKAARRMLADCSFADSSMGGQSTAQSTHPRHETG
jgi:Family of unknown function (DUF6635)